MSSIVVNVPRFHGEWFPKDGLCALIARRGAGKSHYATWRLSTLPFVRNGTVIVMAGTPKVRAEWSKHVPRLFVHVPSVELLARITADQSKLTERYGERYPESLHLTLILDDMASLPKFMKSNELAFLASNSRNLNMCVVLITQYIIQIPKEVRSQLDIIMALGTRTTKAMNTLADEYCTAVDARTFRAVCTDATKDRGVLIIDTRSTARHALSYDRAVHPLPKNTRLGSDAQWAFSDRHFLDLEKSRAESALAAIVDENEDLPIDMGMMDELRSQRQIYTDRSGNILVIKQGSHVKEKAE